ncbi:MAG TPA: enoyl-CoA hydratase/isomerase family protein [Casimicrobiaceae bacterium]|nr:enoyl-CoA hydratase/isomerase family protein [Casimicrobiaceae bacterium]
MASPRTPAKKATRRVTRAAPAVPAQLATLTVERTQGVALVTMNRPEVHNAFDETSIAEMTQVVAALDADDGVRVIVLAGNGASFSAGADLRWMRRMAGYGRAENLADAKALAAMLSTIYRANKPTLARVHGNAFGGGVGLIACCDVAIGAQEAEFALSEARLGLIPATVAPYVVEAIGARQARRYFVTAERFTAAEAFRIGLLHDIVPATALNERVDDLLNALLAAGPDAQRECKALIRNVARGPIDARMIAGTAQHIAAVRASSEGKEGVAAFLGKRPAAWVKQ